VSGATLPDARDGESTRRPERAGWGWWMAVVGGFFIVYNLNGRDIGFGDSVPTTLLPASIVREANFTLDEFEAVFDANPLELKFVTRWIGAIQRRDGHLVSSYPVGGAMLAVPVYLPALLADRLHSMRDYRIAGKIAASLMVALSAGFLYLAARQLAGDRAALVAAVGYGGGTVAWTVASQSLWQHGPGMLCLSVALLALFRLEASPRGAIGLLAGTALGGSILCRHLNVIPAAALSAFVLLRHRRHLVPFAAPLVLMGGWQVWYNLATFGNLSGGYDAIYLGPALRQLRLYESGVFSYPFWLGLSGILVSPGKGLLVFSPHLVFAFAAMVPAWRSQEFPLARYLVAWTVVLLAVMSKNVLWWGGASYGPRYMCELLLPLSLFFALAWRRVAGSRVLASVALLAIGWGVGVQVIGALFTPCGWQGHPVDIHVAPEQRIWDWRDPEIARCLVAGLRDGPRAGEFFAPPPRR
jgi:hypothetical protein